MVVGEKKTIIVEKYQSEQSSAKKKKNIIFLEDGPSECWSTKTYDAENGVYRKIDTETGAIIIWTAASEIAAGNWASRSV